MFFSVSRQTGRGMEIRRETPAVIFAMCYGNRCDFNYYAARRRVTDVPPPPPPPPLVFLAAHLSCGCMLKSLIPLQEKHTCWQLLKSHFVPLAVTRVHHQRTSLSPPTYSIPCYISFCFISLFEARRHEPVTQTRCGKHCFAFAFHARTSAGRNKQTNKQSFQMKDPFFDSSTAFIRKMENYLIYWI